MLEIQNSYGVVSECPRWSNDLFIVGGGPSAQAFDYNLLLHQKVLAINDMFIRLTLLDFSHPVVAFSMDNHWVRRNRDFLALHGGEKFVALPLETWPDCGGIPGVTYLKWGHDNGFSDDPAVLNTGNSGYGALNLAYLKNVRRIFLIGFDLDPRSNPLHLQWALLFRTTIPQLAAKRIAVFNLNPRTYIDAFPTAEIGRFTLSEEPGDVIPPPGPQERSHGAKNAQETGFQGPDKSPGSLKGRI